MPLGSLFLQGVFFTVPDEIYRGFYESNMSAYTR